MLHVRLLTTLATFSLTIGPMLYVKAQTEASLPLDHRASRQQQVRFWMNTADHHQRQGQWVEAERLLDLAIAAQHNLVDAYLLRAKVREQRGNLVGANADYTSVVHLEPERYDARFQRAWVLMAAHRYPAARADFQFLIEHPSLETSTIYYRGEEWNNSLVVTGVTTLQLSMRPEWLNAVGLTYYHEGEYDHARAYFSQALSEDSTYADGYLNLGLTAEGLNDTLGAIAYYQKALAQEPDHAAALRNLASLARIRKDDELLQQINLEYGGDSYEGLIQHGLTCLERNDFTSAIDKFTQALAWQPDDNEAHLQRGFAYEKAELFAEAVADYSTVIKRDPSAEKAYFNRGNVYFKSERYLLAVADYTQAIALNPVNARALYNRGIAYQRLEQLNSACQDWQQAQDLGDPAADRPLSSLCNQ